MWKQNIAKCIIKEMKIIKIEKERLDEILLRYKGYEISNENNEYLLHSFCYDNTYINVYDNKNKSYYKITFFGQKEKEEASLFSLDVIDSKTQHKNKAKESDHYICFDEQIGSDEVGAGDLFLPLIVVSVYLDKQSIKLIDEFSIKDSKKMGDEKIREIIPLILPHIKASKLTLPNEKYSELTSSKRYNMVSIKVKMHNSALRNLKYHHENAKVFVDEFVNKNKFYEYLNGEDYVVSNIIFKEKGETYYPSVALASCVARYYLLKHKEMLEEKYLIDIPFGAGKKADEALDLFIKTYGVSEAKKVIKSTFKNCLNKL